MPEALHVTARCPECGGETPREGERCDRCRAGSGEGSPAAPSRTAVERLQEADESHQPLPMRILASVIYLLAGSVAVYFSIPFFQQGEWWFGLMGVGLAVIAAVGVKESLFPTEWKPD